jgi:hypothetical protein
MNHHYRNLVLFMLAISLISVSCEKAAHVGMGEEATKAKINLINAAPDAGAPFEARQLGFYFKYNKFEYYTQPLQFPWASQYIAIEPGEVQVDLDTSRALNATIPGPRATVLSFKENLEAKAYYSLYVTRTAQQPEYVLIKDDVSLPSAGKVKVRFLNFSTDAGPIDIVDVGTNTQLASGITYKTVSGFIEMAPADYANVRIRSSATNVFISPANRRVLLEKNGVYTVWATGLRSPVPGASHTLRLAYHANRYTF